MHDYLLWCVACDTIFSVIWLLSMEVANDGVRGVGTEKVEVF